MTALRRTPRIVNVEEIPSSDEGLQIGQWYWYTTEIEYVVERHECTMDEWKKGRRYGDNPPRRTIAREEEVLTCLTDLGSNYAELSGRGKHDPWRVHFDEFAARTRRELDPQSVLDAGRLAAQQRLNMLLDEAKEITRRLGLADSVALGPATDAALATVSASDEPGRYKAELKKAKDTTLPQIFKAIDEASKDLTSWLTATTLSLRAQAEQGREVIEAIEDRIFTVELYAGMTERVEKIRDGAAAAYHEKIHLLQGLRYMDEECLAQYEAGGMDFKDQAAFDKWLCRADNLQRLLPYPRTVCAFRVRRHGKDYSDEISLDPWICFAAAAWSALNKKTFLYIRNGKQVYRLATDVEFGERLFPNGSQQVLANAAIWIVPHGRRGHQEILSDPDYQALKAKELRRYEEQQRAYKQFEKDRKRLEAEHGRAEKNRERAIRRREQRYQEAVQVHEQAGKIWTSKDKRKWIQANPEPPRPDPVRYVMQPHAFFEHTRYRRLDPQDVAYDDLMRQINAAVKQYNKIAVVLQGLLDRSPIFHPHPGWKIFTPEGMSMAVELSYDTDRAISAGDAPDFEAYRARLNAQIQIGDITIGQASAWYDQAKKSHADRYGSRSYFDRYGNDGPGRFAAVCGLSRDRKIAKFTWKRERKREVSWRQRMRGTVSNELTSHFSIEIAKLFNVSAYTPGDFHQFFDDPRTRTDYLKWAPLLLPAENWHAEQSKKNHERSKDRETAEQAPSAPGAHRSRRARRKGSRSKES